MTKVGQHRAARAWTLAPLLVVSALGRPAMAAHAPFERELEDALGTVPPELSTALGSLHARRAPVEVLEQKLREGLAKRVPPRRIGETLARMAVGLVWIEDQLTGCRGEQVARARDAMRTLATDLLLGGVDQARLGPAMARACAQPDPAAWAAETGELYFLLVNRLDAARPAAWELTLAAIASPDARAGLSALVGCLQDISRTRGSVDRPVQVALERLRAGSSLRRVRLELEERFLR